MTRTFLKGTRIVDMTGQVFGDLIILSLHETRDTRSYWNCRCVCGGVKPVRRDALLAGDTVGCGCKKADNARQRFKTHGASQTPLYDVWNQMIQRCTNPKAARFFYYGGCGIKVCDRWLKFENFFEDMGERPDGMSLDRIDVRGNYEKSNCRWTDSVTQARNTRNYKEVSKDREQYLSENPDAPLVPRYRPDKKKPLKRKPKKETVLKGTDATTSIPDSWREALLRVPLRIDAKPLINVRKERLLVKGVVGRDDDGRLWSECLCDCGVICYVRSSALGRKVFTRSCGCLVSEVGKRNEKHGMSQSGTYYSWKSMKGRCLNENDPGYTDYGGRGIKVCDAWLTFEGFLEDMGERPAGTTIERIDVNGNYEKANCRWADATHQSRNTRTRTQISADQAKQGVKHR